LLILQPTVQECDATNVENGFGVRLKIISIFTIRCFSNQNILKKERFILKL